MIAAYDMHCNESRHVPHVVISLEVNKFKFLPPYILSEIVKPHQGWTEK